MSGLGFSSSAPYNQDEEVRRFQEEQRAKERERIRREQEAQQQRRRGYRPDDPQMGPDGRPQWPYNRPHVGPRVTGEVIRVLDNVPGVNRITGPAITVGTAASGGPPPGEPPLPGPMRRPRGSRVPADMYGKKTPYPDLDPRLPPERQRELAARTAYHARDKAGLARRYAQQEAEAGNHQAADHLRSVADWYEREADRYARKYGL
jgi:hypothetical protein